METMPIYPREKTGAESEVEAQLNSAFDTWWERVGLPPQNFVYLLFDARGHLLYVGITNNLRNRLSAHYSEKPWIEEVTRAELEVYVTREESKARESYLIKERGPVYNLAENQRLTNVVSYFSYKIAESCPGATWEGIGQLVKAVDRQYVEGSRE